MVILLLVFLSAKSGRLVHDLNAQLVGSLDDLLTLFSADSVRDDGGELLVVHQQHLNVRGSSDQERVQTVLELETGRSSRTVSDLGHQDGALELSADSVINTTRLSPRRLQID